MTRIAIVGSREFADRALVRRVIHRLMEKHGPEHLTIVSGGARGADTLAEDLARAYKLDCLVFPADWETYGKRAGFHRNAVIVDNADEVIALYADGPLSAGTSHTVKLALAAGLRVHIYHEGRWNSTTQGGFQFPSPDITV
jgi:hypothetical protein